LNYEEAIKTQYGQSDLDKKILAVLVTEGLDTSKLIQEGFAPIEELHLRGSLATIELAREAGLNENMKVLDIGCGIGGPARTIASEFGCYVIGLDLSEEFCRAAKLINDKVGLCNKIEIRHGNALEMPFNTKEFDVVFMQHVLMNIEDKNSVFSHINRILRSKGRLALYTICAGPNSPVYFPVIWANNPDINFLLTVRELRQLISSNGFEELSWKDVTKKILEGIERARSKPRSKVLRPISLSLIVSDPSTKWKNIVRNLKEERIVVIQGIFEKI